jgi:outer membrane protein OmpA-like peptidoglycan-associated protein
MRKSEWCFWALFLLTAIFFSACAYQGAPPPAFDAQPIAAVKWNKKAGYLYFILDASSSMGQAYKLETARGVICNFNKTMPPLDIKVAVRSFGHHEKVSAKYSELMVRPQTYSADAVSGGLAKVSEAGGFSPLDRALKDAASDLKDIQTPIAMLIVSDGKDMGDGSVAAAETLKENHGDRLCIYTVLVGNASEGQKLLAKIARVTGCGQALTADSLATGAAMNAFVQEVLLAGRADSDGDGVSDDRDRCPDTSAGVKVDTAGCPLDSDGDGVSDDRDRCPDTSAGVKVDTVGCPLDSDGDGVSDDRDRCPDTSAGVKVDTVGCPLDSDGDGISDDIDSCPNTPIGMKVDLLGCPPDSDRDGVPDDNDRCSNTPKGAKVDIQGCPIAVAALGVATEAGTYVFKDIRFEPKKSDLKARSYPTLNKIAEALKARPGLNVEIQGHTDNRGNHDDNINLSQSRAESVKAYLVSKGVDGERLAARGYGPDRPVATNATAKGRARNRRVEFRPLQ